jgi:hypothetical protein
LGFSSGSCQHSILDLISRHHNDDYHIVNDDYDNGSLDYPSLQVDKPSNPRWSSQQDPDKGANLLGERS